MGAAAEDDGVPLGVAVRKSRAPPADPPATRSLPGGRGLGEKVGQQQDREDGLWVGPTFLLGFDHSLSVTLSPQNGRGMRPPVTDHKEL